MAKDPVKSRVSGCPKRLWLFNLKPRHKPVELLPGDRSYFGTVARPAVFSVYDIQPFVQKDVPIRLTEQNLDTVTSFAAEEIDCMTEWRTTSVWLSCMDEI